MSDELQHLRREVERLTRHNRELWSECQARGEILDEIQAEARCHWWYGALYKLRDLRGLLRRADGVLRMLPPPASDCYTNSLQADMHKEVSVLGKQEGR